ncbi:MAG TPA: M20/M25/M40 family metallo-hydrolase [Patescibacteria group bacterium]|nr:M20/M25/M40 family metallo-hydrolase [Patescibacteria group bacterium]
MRTYKTPLELAKKLISLPSYVDSVQDEMPAIEFLEQYISTNLPELTVERQAIDGGSPRCNLIIRGKGDPKLFMLGHIDTVQPKEGWRTDPLKPIVRDGKLYGLGAADMKSSLAAFLWALIQNKQAISLDNLMLLIYVDEEYDFKGMLRFVQDKQITKLRPKMTLSLDGDLEVATGCRGVIELKLLVQGKSGHASNPANGVNAISETVLALQKVSQELDKFTDPALGAATTNIAYLQGGTQQQGANGKISWSQEGNVIADTAEVIFEARTPLTQVNAESVVQMIDQQLQARGLTLKRFSVRHDIKPWPVVCDEATLDTFKRVYTNADVPFVLSDRALTGYIDAQMIAEKIDAPTFIIGTGGENKHGANENVSVESIGCAARLYAELLRQALGS